MAAPVLGNIQTAEVVNGGTTDPLVITKPTSTAEGDLLIMVANCRDTSSRNLNTLSGWTRIYNAHSTLAGLLCWTQVYYKVAGASEPSTYSWAVSATFTKARAWMARISGAEDPATTAIVQAYSADGSSGNAISPAVTPTDADSLVIRHLASPRTSSGGLTFPTATEQLDTIGTNVRHGFGTFTHGTTSTGTETITYTPTWWSSPAWGHFTMAIAPPGGAGHADLTVTEATVTVAGQSADLSVARQLAASNAAVASGGQSSSLATARQLAASNGAVASVGQSSDLVTNRQLVAAEATVSVSGQSADMAVARQLAAVEATVLSTGQSAVMAYGNILTANLATATLAGQSATLSISRQLSAVNATAIIAGQSATLTGSGAAEPITGVLLGLTPARAAYGAIARSANYQPISRSTNYQKVEVS